MTIQLPPETEARLKNAANLQRVDVNDYAVQLIEQGLPKKDQATLDLLDRWREEDRTDDPAEIERRTRDCEEFMQNLDRNRREMEGPNARRLWP